MKNELIQNSMYRDLAVQTPLNSALKQFFSEIKSIEDCEQLQMSLYQIREYLIEQHYRRQLFQYNEVQRGLDAVGRADTQYGVSTRVGGLAQATGGVAATAFGVGLCESGIGCVAGVPVAAYGVDNAVAGARAVYSGKNHATVGAKALSELTGMSSSTAEALYSAPSLIYGAKPIVSGLNTAGKVAAKETSQMANATKHMVGEVGKDVRAGINAANNYVNDVTSAIPHNKYVFGITDKIGKGIESIENITPKQYIFGSSVGYFASSTSQYIFNGDIDHSKSLKVGLITPYLTLTSPATGMIVGAADTALSTKIEGKENYLKEQEKYLKSSAISEIINSNPYLQKHPLGDVIKVINNEMINEVIDDDGNK